MTLYEFCRLAHGLTEQEMAARYPIVEGFWMPPIVGTAQDTGSRCPALSVEYDTRCVLDRHETGPHVALTEHFPFTPRGIADQIDAEVLLKFKTDRPDRVLIGEMLMGRPALACRVKD